MSAGNGSDSTAPARWRSTYGLAEPESRDAAREPPPLTSWRSAGNLHGAGTLPRPWSRQRTGTNVQKLLNRLQSQEEDKPRPSWADQLDDGQTTDAPRTSLDTGSKDSATGGEARRRPRPRPRSMGVLLGLRQEDTEEEEEREVTRPVGRRGYDADVGQSNGAVGGQASREPPVKAPSEARRSVLSAARSYEALDSDSGRSGSRAGPYSVKEGFNRVRGAPEADSYSGTRRADASDISKIRNDARSGESSPDKYVAVRVNTRLNRARAETDDTDDKKIIYTEPQTQTLPSTARYRENTGTAQSNPARKLSAAEASIVRGIKNAAKSASGRTSNDEADVVSAQRAPARRKSAARTQNSSAEEHEQTATLRPKTPTKEEAPKARSRSSPPPPDLIPHADGRQLRSGRTRFRRAEVIPAEEPDGQEIKREEGAGKVEVKIVAVEVKAVKAEVKPAEAETKKAGEDVDGITRARANTEDTDRRTAGATAAAAAAAGIKAKLAKAKSTENPNIETTDGAAKPRYRRDNENKDQKVRADSETATALYAEIISVEADEKPVEEPKYKPVAAPRRLTASGQTLGQTTAGQRPRRSGH